MASTIIFGLLFSTIAALIVVPSIYGLLYDHRKNRAEATAEATAEASASGETGYAGAPQGAYAGGDD